MNEIYLVRINGLYKIATLSETTEYLAMKDGAELVHFENGNVGYISDQGSIAEIICKANEIVSRFGYVYPRELAKANWNYGFDLDDQEYAEEIVGKLNERR